MVSESTALLNVMNFVTLLFSGITIFLFVIIYKHWKYWKKVSQFMMFTMMGMVAFFVHESLDYFPSIGLSFSYLRFFQGVAKLVFVEFLMLGLFFAIKEIKAEPLAHSDSEGGYRYKP